MKMEQELPQKTYLRDGRAPIPKSVAISRSMSSNKGKDTTPELIFRKYLYDYGLRGYRIHWKKIPGKPDICYPGRKIAIFVNGCFWHRCPKCDLPLPKTNTEFWREKFEKNQYRDKVKIEQLEKLGWKVVVVWECEIKSEIQTCLERVISVMNL